MGYAGGSYDLIIESVYSTLFLDKQKPGKFLITVKNETTVDALMDML